MLESIIKILKQKSTLGEKVFSKHFPNEYKIIKEYTDKFNIVDWSECKYFYINQLNEIPKCKICGNNVKFYKSANRYKETCCRECDRKLKSLSHQKIWNNYTDEEKLNRLNHASQIKEERYGYSSPFASSKVKQKIKESNLNKYGVDNYFKSSQFKQYMEDNFYNNKEYIQKKTDKAIQTCNIKYNANSFTQTKEGKQKIKESNIKKYGIDNYAKSDDFKELFKNKEFVDKITTKNYLTKKKHNTFNTSKPEELLYTILNEKFDVKRQYKSNVYSFVCDFYIPSMDLYIEYNGSWTHGGCPFDSNDSNCMSKLNHWKSKNSQYYKNAIDTWTIRDVKKRQVAKNNNLNWIEFFNINEFIEWIRNYDKL